MLRITDEEFSRGINPALLKEELAAQGVTCEFRTHQTGGLLNFAEFDCAPEQERAVWEVLAAHDAKQESQRERDARLARDQRIGDELIVRDAAEPIERRFEALARLAGITIET